MFVLLLATALVLIVLQRQQITRFKGQNVETREQLNQLLQLRDTDQLLTNRLRIEQEHQQSEHTELLRARAQVSRLKQIEQENTRLRKEHDRLSRNSEQPRDSDRADTTDEQSTDEKTLSAKRNLAKNLATTLIVGAEANAFRLPDALSTDLLLAVDALSKWSSSNNTAGRFELVYKGSLLDVAGSFKTVMLREKEATQLSSGQWVKTYAFTDGHIDTATRPDKNDFAVVETRLGLNHLK